MNLNECSSLAFAGLILLYIPVAGLGFAAFGNHVQDSLIKNFDDNWLTYVIQVCFLVHSFTVMLIIVNPVYLDLEELLRIPKSREKD